MPSSTSNSKLTSPGDRAPELAWNRVWVLTAILIFGLLGTLEAFWRSRGFEPSVADTPQLWAYHRGRVYDGEEKAVVLVGMSRMQAGFSTETFQNRFPNHEVVQLSIVGKYPIATLRDLANDEDFKGTVICSLTSPGISRQHWNDQKDFVENFHRRRGIDKQINQRIECWFQNYFTVLNPQLNARRTLIQLLRHQKLQEPDSVITLADRSQSRLANNLDLISRRRKYLKKTRSIYERMIFNKAEWLEDAFTVESLVQKIHLRGGTVAFVRFPVSEERYALAEEFYPREKYWDRFIEITSAVTIHYRDIPSWNNFYMPDLSHIDHTDKPRFTNALLDELSKRGILKQ